MRKSLPYAALTILVACFAAHGQATRPHSETNRRATNAPLVFLDSTRERDGLKGAVRRVETEVVKVEMEGGALVEKSRSILERTLYDVRGRRIENETYPVVSKPAGREAHSYDAQGNLAETVVRDERSVTLSRTVYKYEFDAQGNWVKMTASVAVVKGGQVAFEPFEITNRSITYYLLDDAAAGAKPARGAGDAEAVKVSGNEEERGARATDGSKPRETQSRETQPRAIQRHETQPREMKTREMKPRETARVAHVEARAVNVGVLNDRATWLPPITFAVAVKRLDKPVTISVDVVVDATGRVVEATAETGSKALRQAAEDAARHTTFLPYYSEGRPARVRGWLNFGLYFAP
jgi:hypothetical protein